MSSVERNAATAVYELSVYIDNHEDEDHAVHTLPARLTLAVALDIYGDGQAEQTVAVIAALLGCEDFDEERVGQVVRYVRVVIAVGHIGDYDFAGAVRALRRRVAAAA